MRRTYATHALQRGADVTTARDNLRHSSVATTSVYLHTFKRSEPALTPGVVSLIFEPCWLNF